MSRNDENNYTLRPLTIDDAEEYNALLRYAFQVTEQELAETGWKDDEITQSKFPVLQRADVLGCFNGNDLIAQFAVYPLDMNIYGVKYSVGFVTSVCTYPEYTGHGIMKRLMIQSLIRMRDAHKSFALLYPYSIPLYRGLGWEIISNKMTYTIKDTQIPRKLNEPGYVRRVSWDDKEFKELHTKFAEKTHGCLYRNNLAWEEYWRWDEDDTVVAVYYNSHKKPQGYMVYLIKENVMYIKEMIFLNREAQNGLWRFIRAHQSMINEVKGNTYYNEPIAFEMADGNIKESIRPYIMGRIIDIDKFLLQYSCKPSEKDVCIELDIHDDFLSWNNKSINVLFSKGRCFITEQKAEYHIKLDIASLTTLLIGYKSAMQLWKLERIDAPRAAVETLDNVLMHEIPYISDYI